MASYLMLGNFTDQGIRNVEETIKRGERFKEMAKECGVEVKELMWLMGDHDVFCIAEAENDHAITTLLLRRRDQKDSPRPAPTGPSTRTRWAPSSKKCNGEILQ